MYFVIFTLILVGMSFWSGRECLKSNRMETFYMVPIVLCVFFIYYLLLYLELCEGVTLPGLSKKLVYMLLNTLFPLCYLYVCQQANIRKLTPTTIGLFALTLYNLISNTTIFTDSIPVSNVRDEIGIYFYRDGDLWFRMNTYEFVEFIQLIWISIRATILFKKIKEREFKFTKGGLAFEIFIFTALAFSTLSVFIPDSYHSSQYLCELYISVHLAIACSALFIIGKGYHINIIVDKNNETAYLEHEPKYEKVKSNFERSIIQNRLYLNPDLTNEKIIKIVGTNRTYMAEMMKNMYDDTLNSYINKLRIEEAKRLLQSDEDLKLEDIAKRCGFTVASTFTKVFNKETGVNPSVWRPNM